MDTDQTDESLAKQQIRPEQITRPIQLLAAWLTGLVLVDGLFLTAATYLTTLTWAAGLLIIAAVVNVPLFLISLFVLQTRFRPEMQEDIYYSKYLEDKQKRVELKTVKLQEEIDRTIRLADVRVELSEAYIERVTSSLDLDEGEKARLRRALRDAVRAKEERASQDLNLELLEGVQTRFLSPEGRPSSTQELWSMEELINIIAAQRYKVTSDVHSSVTQDDVSSIDLSSSIRRTCQALLQTAEDENKTIELVLPQHPLNALGTRGIIETAFTELLTNAVVYSPEGSVVNVNVSHSGVDRIRIEIENPISEQIMQGADIDRLFEPGYRGPQSMRQFPVGKGMGLHLVKRALELIGGSVEMRVINERFNVTVYLASASGFTLGGEEITPRL